MGRPFCYCFSVSIENAGVRTFNQIRNPESVIDKMATRHECHLCEYTVKDKCNLKTHINMMHTRKNLYQCSACEFKTYSDGYLRSHKKKLNPNSDYNEAVELLHIQVDFSFQFTEGYLDLSMHGLGGFKQTF